ncbi:MAG: CBS domain-containing protein [Candidatus Rokubacteria bacterium]|nr:CBS domain-containing protein [Candidatus Rokubacteria bacterium]
MKIQDVMTQDVITVSPETPIHKAARLMVDHGVSGLPVVDEQGQVVGIVSEGDLIVRQKTRERLPWWRFFLEDADQLAREYQKRAGTTVGEVMTRSVISVSPELPVESAATILDKNRIRRLPVVAGGGLAGIVSRGDLIKALAATPPRGAPLSDAQLVKEMKRRLAWESWSAAHALVITARDGVLSLWGVVESETEKSALGTMARTIDGCTSVEDHLVVKSDIPYYYGV